MGPNLYSVRVHCVYVYVYSQVIHKPIDALYAHLLKDQTRHVDHIVMFWNELRVRIQGDKLVVVFCDEDIQVSYFILSK